MNVIHDYVEKYLKMCMSDPNFDLDKLLSISNISGNISEQNINISSNKDINTNISKPTVPQYVPKNEPSLDEDNQRTYLSLIKNKAEKRVDELYHGIIDNLK